MKSVVVVGSGFTGFECARRLARQMRRRNAPVTVTLISPVDYMLYTPLLPEVDIRLGVTLKEVHADHVVLTNDSVVGTHTVAWLTGVTAAPLIETLGLPTAKGRLKVQADLQVPGHPHVFAAGDAAAVPITPSPTRSTSTSRGIRRSSSPGRITSTRCRG